MCLEQDIELPEEARRKFYCVIPIDQNSPFGTTLDDVFVNIEGAEAICHAFEMTQTQMASRRSPHFHISAPPRFRIAARPRPHFTQHRGGRATGFPNATAVAFLKLDEEPIEGNKNVFRYCLPPRLPGTPDAYSLLRHRGTSATTQGKTRTATVTDLQYARVEPRDSYQIRSSLKPGFSWGRVLADNDHRYGVFDDFPVDIPANHPDIADLRHLMKMVPMFRDPLSFEDSLSDSLSPDASQPSDSPASPASSADPPRARSRSPPRPNARIRRKRSRLNELELEN